MKTLKDTNGNTITRLSRWIKIRYNYNPTKANSLWDYVVDDHGEHPYSSRFDPDEGLYLAYFKWNGRTYAIDQFGCLGSIWCGGAPIGYEEDGKLNFIGGVDMEDYYNPIYIEMDEYCEYVRVYEC